MADGSRDGGHPEVVVNVRFFGVEVRDSSRLRVPVLPNPEAVDAYDPAPRLILVPYAGKTYLVVSESVSTRADSTTVAEWLQVLSAALIRARNPTNRGRWVTVVK